MSKETFYVSPVPKGWQVERVSNRRKTLFQSKEAAERYAEGAARFSIPSEVVVRRPDGGVGYSWKYD